jgi:hypothetical protein
LNPLTVCLYRLTIEHWLIMVPSWAIKKFITFETPSALTEIVVYPPVIGGGLTTVGGDETVEDAPEDEDEDEDEEDDADVDVEVDAT